MSEALRDVGWFLSTFDVLEDGLGRYPHADSVVSRDSRLPDVNVHDANIVATMLAYGERRLLTFDQDDFHRYRDRSRACRSDSERVNWRTGNWRTGNWELGTGTPRARSDPEHRRSPWHRRHVRYAARLGSPLKRHPRLYLVDLEIITAVPLGPYENGPGTPCAGMMGLVKPTENTEGTKPVAHNDTVFAQVLKLVPRHEFESLARKHKSGRMSRSMTRWGQFVAMGMAQLTGRCSLRDIVSNLAAQSCKLYHLGVGVVTRSSLARVNAEKPWEMYEELHGRLLGRCQAKAPGHGYRFKAKLFSVDSTTIDLCLSAFPWAKFRRTKGAVKVHVGLDHEGYLPTFVRVTNGKTSDIEAARALTLPKGSIVAADRAYVDFVWIDSLISEGIHLVTRLKRGIKYGVVETREVNAKRGVTSDETIEFTSAKGRKQCPHRLRRIGYHDRKTGKDYVFLTTHFHLSAKTIADIYKSRWQVELFFKWIKQNLKVKSFVGTSRNAVMTQVWTAMCIYLILSYIKFANRIAWRLSEILRLLQLNLFERRPLRELLGSGNESPPDRSSQLTMKFTWT